MRTLAVCLVLSCASIASAAAPPARDPDLPRGARLRLGAARWRFHFGPPPPPPGVLSADGNMLANPRDDGPTEGFDPRPGRRGARFPAEPGRIQFTVERCYLYPLAF